jgi:hypothetical protein
MRKHALVLAALLAAGAAQAQVTIGGALGSGHLNVDCTGVNSCKTSDTGYKLNVGYKFNDTLGAELGYIGFGKFSATDAGMSVSLKPTALTLALTAGLVASPDWSLNARLGIANVRTSASASVGNFSGSASHNTTQAYAGFGVAYHLSKSTRLDLALDSSRAEFGGEKAAVRLFSIGATTAF